MAIYLLFLFLASYLTWINTGECDSLFYNEGCASNEISFKRVRYVGDQERGLAIFLYGQSGDMTFVNTRIIFSDENTHFHNTLLLNPVSFHKYEKIARISEFGFNNEMIMTTRGRRILLQYDIATEQNYSSYFHGHRQEYDAVLLLDPYSSMWHEYNTIIFEPSQMILRYENESSNTVDDNEDFIGHYTVQCNQSVSNKICHVETGSVSGLWTNNHFYPGYRLIINPNRVSNYLPTQLYVAWLSEKDKKLTIGSDNNENVLILFNEQYKWELNDETNDIIVGVDLIHFFQKIHYHLPTQKYKLYYTHTYSRYTEHLLHIFFITYFVTTIMTNLFNWYTYDNYDILGYILVFLHKKEMKRFPFAINQIYDEISSILLCIALIFMTMFFTDPVSSVHFSYSHTTFQRRKILLYCYAVYNIITALLVLIMTKEVTKKFFTYSYNWLIFTIGVDKRDQEYEFIKKNAENDISRMNTKYVLVRNLTLHNLICLNMLFIFNYMTEENPVFGILYILFNLSFIFFTVYYLHIDILYLYALTRKELKDVIYNNILFFLYITINIGLIIFYIGLSVPVNFINLFQIYNSIYPQSIITLFTLLMVVVIITIAVQSVVVAIDEIKNLP